MIRVYKYINFTKSEVLCVYEIHMCLGTQNLNVKDIYDIQVCILANKSHPPPPNHHETLYSLGKKQFRIQLKQPVWTLDRSLTLL